MKSQPELLEIKLKKKIRSFKSNNKHDFLKFDGFWLDVIHHNFWKHEATELRNLMFQNSVHLFKVSQTFISCAGPLLTEKLGSYVGEGC